MEWKCVFQVGQQMFIQPNTIHMLPNLIKTQSQYAWYIYMQN